MAETITRTVWVVAQEDPSPEDIAQVNNFINHFPGPIDITTNRMRIKSAPAEMNGNHIRINGDGKLHSIKNGQKRHYKKRNKAELPPEEIRNEVDAEIEKETGGRGHFKDGVNNTKFPTVRGRQPKVRCTGCGTYKKVFKPHQVWELVRDELNIGLCNICSKDKDKELEFHETVRQLS